MRMDARMSFGNGVDSRLPEGLTAIVGDVGRKTIRLGLTDALGQLRRETIRAYPSASQTTISGALSTFSRECGLSALPRRCALALSGAARGDTISITNSRWFVSRSGLGSMLRTDPVLINDFAAIAWSLTSLKGSAQIERTDLGAICPATDPGTYCIIGIGSGLGVATLQRDEFGHFSVLATEAGHCSFAPAAPDWQPIVEIMRRTAPCQTGEQFMSAAGLHRAYLACAQHLGAPARATDSVEVVHLAEGARDIAAVKALDLMAQALWQFAGNVVLSHGAWDGVILTGSLVHAMAKSLRQHVARDQFCLPGPFTRELAKVRRSFASFEYAELEGAAQALLLRDRAQALASAVAAV
jgi:glucokinase